MKLSIVIPIYNQEELIIRALDSIPRRNDIEVIIVNDGSTDNALSVLNKYQEEHKDLNIVIYDVLENKGIGNAKNIGYDLAKGEYITQIDSDDYVYTNEYNKVIDILKDYDMIYINLKKNDGSIFVLNEASKRGLCCGMARFIKKSFMGDTRCPEIRAGEDWYLNEDLLKKNPTEYFTNITAYHYNFPREGSLYDMLVKGQL